MDMNIEFVVGATKAWTSQLWKEWIQYPFVLAENPNVRQALFVYVSGDGYATPFMFWNKLQKYASIQY